MNHFNIASKISQIDWTTAELDEIKLMINSLSSSDVQIDFYHYCEAHKLGPLCCAQLIKYDLLSLFEEEVQELFQAIHQKIKEQNEQRNKCARELLQVFVSKKIEVIVLKGNYLAHAVYQEIGYKRMNDFDILIHKEDWDKIQDIYMQLGYIPLGFGWSGEKETPAKFSHVGMSFISPDLSCIVGSQWGLKSPTANFSVDINKAWQSKIPFDFIGIPVHALSCEFNLLHLILHMGIYKCGIRDCMDIYNLVRSKEVNHEQLKEILFQSGASEKAFFTLSLSNLCSESFDTEFIRSLKTKSSGYTQRRLKARLLTHSEAGDFQLSYIDHFQDIEKEVIYFNLFPKFHVKLKYYARFFRLVFFPKTSVCLKLNDKFHKPSIYNKIKSRLKTPYFSFSLVAQEIGWKFTFLLFFKLFIDLFISLKNYFIKKESYFSYLRKRGIDPNEIEKVVSNIQ